jgi:hypothetical protein
MLILVVLFLTPATRADGPKTEDGEPAGSSWLPILKRQGDDYTITLATDPPKQLRRLETPILRWTQPVRGGDDGAVFLWLADGRPEAVGTIFTWQANGGKRVMQHEFHSLALHGLDATWRGTSLWHPASPGVTLLPVPDAPAPAASGNGRLRQMQAIARDFSASSIHETAGRNELRLLPRPLYRYEPKARELIDGALFCLAHGTDPEVFLILEARRADNGSSSWKYALARFSDLPLNVKLKGKTVYEVGHGVMNARGNPHAYYVVEEVDADTPEDYAKLPKSRAAN